MLCDSQTPAVVTVTTGLTSDGQTVITGSTGAPALQAGDTVVTSIAATSVTQATQSTRSGAAAMPFEGGPPSP